MFKERELILEDIAEALKEFQSSEPEPGRPDKWRYFLHVKKDNHLISFVERPEDADYTVTALRDIKEYKDDTTPIRIYETEDLGLLRFRAVCARLWQKIKEEDKEGAAVMLMRKAIELEFPGDPYNFIERGTALWVINEAKELDDPEYVDFEHVVKAAREVLKPNYFDSLP